MLGRIVSYLSLGSWKIIDDEWREPTQDKYDFRPLIVLVVVAVSLTLQEYMGDRALYYRYFPSRAGTHYELLESYVWWSGWRFFGYVVIPILAIFAMPGERLRDYFVSFKDFFKHLPTYAGLFAVVFPAVIIASRMPSFAATYPFYKLANRSAMDLWLWEALYVVQFFSLEFFFRGFMLKSLAPKFGSGAIFVMIVPYCMIHYGKPMSETMGAIVAGIVLGTVALRTRSIWGGVLIHVCVAITMDVLAVEQCPPPDEGPCPGH